MQITERVLLPVPVRHRMSANALAAGLVFLFPLMNSAAAAADSPKTQGYVVRLFVPANFEKNNGGCLDGMAVRPDVNSRIEKHVFTLPADQQEEARKKLKERVPGELRSAWTFRGPGGANVCDNPKAVPDPGQQTVQGKIAYGLNLDGAGSDRAAKNTCKHENFSGPDGEPGIDNQLYRVMGCIPVFWGSEGHLNELRNRMMLDGTMTMLIEVAGIDDPKNDSDVKVTISSGQNPMVLDATGKPLPYQSQTIINDPNYSNVLKGKIVDGTLITEPTNIHLKDVPGWWSDYFFRRGRLQLKFQDDGSLTGVLAGYHAWRPVYDWVATGGGQQEYSSGGGTCPGYYNALKRAADGDPDPKTGECQTISAAFKIEAVPAFNIRPGQTTALAAPK